MMKRKLSDEIKEKARRLAEDPGALRNFVDQVKLKIEELSSNEKLKELFESVKLFINMIKSHISGEYRDIPKRTLLLILFGLIYFLIPIDAIPDFIPITGYVDDLTILLWIYKSVQKDISAYKDWQSSQMAPSN
ncbi:MAG: YkvA family protein [Bacteroidetes bacterium]|nr:YkvA family protein [Bacteroidota bacterium]MDA1119284.1 YkvA family protein [Bacteroidota bacterium]